MDNVSRLNVECQKYGISLPVFEYFQDSTSGKWTACLTGHDIYTDVQSVAHSTKKGAKDDICSQLLIYISENLCSNNDITISEYNSLLPHLPNYIFNKIEKQQNICLIDAENVNVPMDKFKTDTFYLLILSLNSTRLEKIKDITRQVENSYMIVNPSYNKDGADHLLTFTFGKLVYLYPEHKYTIITRDHFAQSLIYFANNVRLLPRL